MPDLTLPNPEPPPMRVESLYQLPTDFPRRPGILTAVGIISIVVASLSLLSSCSMARLGMGMRTTMVPVFTPTTTPTTSSAGGNLPTEPIIDTALLKPASRQMVIATVTRRAPLTAPREEMLDRLLAEAGEDLFPFAEESYTPEKIEASLSDSGRLPGSDDKHPGNNYYVLANGRIEVADDHAVFSPSRRGGVGVVRVYRDDPAKAAALNAPPAFKTMKRIAAPASVITMLVVSVGLNLLLAIGLLVAGILVLRDSRLGRRMHLGYALLKVPAAILGGIVIWRFVNHLTSNTTGGTPGIIGTLSAAIPATLACIYPLALLIVMSVSSVKKYYRTSGGDKST